MCILLSTLTVVLFSYPSILLLASLQASTNLYSLCFLLLLFCLCQFFLSSGWHLVKLANKLPEGLWKIKRNSMFPEGHIFTDSEVMEVEGTLWVTESNTYHQSKKPHPDLGKVPFLDPSSPSQHSLLGRHCFLWALSRQLSQLVSTVCRLPQAKHPRSGNIYFESLLSLCKIFSNGGWSHCLKGTSEVTLCLKGHWTQPALIQQKIALHSQRAGECMNT